jgi:hypothetical protein
VQFWLEQNARMLATTIQALEVQRMTLSTLQTSERAGHPTCRSRCASGLPEEEAAAPAPGAFHRVELVADAAAGRGAGGGRAAQARGPCEGRARRAGARRAGRRGRPHAVWAR